MVTLAVLDRFGPSEMIYPVIAAALVVASFAFLRRPLVNLVLVLCYLVVANNASYVLGQYWSAAIATLLIANCLVGALLLSQPKASAPGNSGRVALLLSSIAALQAAYGLARGNPTSLVLGDFYQILEFASLFALSGMLVRTEQQLKTVVLALAIATLITSGLQTLDAVMEAPYLPGMEGLGTKRIINMYAPMMFIVLLAAVASMRQRTLAVIGLVVVEGYVIVSFSRGLWLATAVSTVFLLAVLHGPPRRAVFKLGCMCAALGLAAIFASDLGPLVAQRINFGVEQVSHIPSAPEAGTTPRAGTAPGADASSAAALRKQHAAPAATSSSDILASRRSLEHVLLLRQIAERPLLGHGLGATYMIAGDAVMGGPKGQQIAFHFVHDLYLAVAFRFGLPALLLFLWLLWIYFRQALENLRRRSPSHEATALLAGLVAVIFGQAVLCVTSPVFFTHPTGGVIGSIMAITLAKLRPDLPDSADPASDD